MPEKSTTLSAPCHVMGEWASSPFWPAGILPAEIAPPLATRDLPLHSLFTHPDLTYTYEPLGRLDTVKRGSTLHAHYHYTGLQLTSEDLNLETACPRTLTRTYENLPDSLPGYRPDGYSFIEDSTAYSADWSFDTANTLSRFAYAVNAIGQREEVATTGSAFTSPSDSCRNWQYDALVQLDNANSPVDVNDRAYTYDTIGNRKGFQKGATAVPLTPTADTTSYAANGANQYSAITVGTGAAMNPAPFNDADGNMTTGPVPGANGLTLGVPAPSSATLEWDAENRLVKAVVNNITVNYAYDHLSRLISRGEGVTPATWTHYRYDGWNRIAEYSGTALSKVYTWGLDLSGSPQGAGGVGGLLCVLDKPTGSRSYPAYDGNGNVSEYVNNSGSQSAHFEYDPYGNLTADTGGHAADFPFRFSTKPQDAVTGLCYYGYRWYDPLTGRWPSRDPIEEQGGVNLYG